MSGMAETYGIKRCCIGGLDVCTRGKQRVPRGCRLHLSGNLSHATQRFVVGSKGNRVEREGFPSGGEVGHGAKCSI